MSPSFAQAIARREEHGPVAVDPRDGAVLDLATVDHELLAEVLLELRRRETQMKEWRAAVENELVRRYGERRAAQPVGNFEINVDQGFRREWDANNLLDTLTDLEERGLVRAADVVGVVEVMAKVNGTEAARLLTRSQGEVLTELSECFTWKPGRPRVTVTPAVSLEP